MFSHLLKRVIPFTLTFILGATLGGFFKLFRSGETRSVGVFTSRRAYEYNYGMGHGCDHKRNLVAESKPLVILFKPDARWPRGLEAEKSAFDPVRVAVTFGADGKVIAATPEGSCFSDSAVSRVKSIRDAAERAALMIQFEPETINGIPVSVTKDVEIHFIGQE